MHRIQEKIIIISIRYIYMRPLYSNDTRKNLNHKINKNKPCLSSSFFLLFSTSKLHYTLYVFDCYYLYGNSYLGCFTVELYPTGLQVGQCFFPSTFYFFLFFPQSIVRMIGDSSLASAYRVIVSGRFFFFFLYIR